MRRHLHFAFPESPRIGICGEPEGIVRRKMFTLIELLVVIAIVAILASMLCRR